MKKIKAGKGSDLIIKYTLKALVLSVITVLILSAAASFICLKFDIDIEVLKYLSVAICGICAAFTGWFCVFGFKNNGFALGAFSTLPLIIYSFINMLIHSSGGLIFIIKIALCIAIGGLCGAASIRKSKRIKVK
jgi:putative membrane protein (TIGR04086 family)